jgi:AraC-like DNA-binding protein
VSLWFRRSYERVLQRDTNVGTGTLVRATPAGGVPRCRIGGYHEDHGPLGRSTLHARRGNPLGRYQLLAAEVGIRAVLLKRRLDEALRLMLATSKEERSLTDIARCCGLGGTSQFSRAFRARFGMPPRHR